MRKILKSALFVALMSFGVHAAQAANPLVDVAWVKANLGKPGLVFLDVASNPGVFAKGHVPGAIYTHYKKDKWRVDGKKRGKKVAGLLPDMAHLAKLIGGLGIGNDDHVVVIPAGASAVDMGTATRVYWTFKVLGHEEVSILNGGNRAYMKDKKNPLETGMSKPEGTTFKVAMNTKYLATEEDVRAAVKGGAALLDSRSQSQFMGMNKSGKVQKAGTLPGAVSVPGEWMTVNGGGQIRSGQALKKLYAMTEAPTEGAAITFCNTGHWASLGWFVNSEVLGNKNTKMYDGSMAEYTTDPSVEMDRKVNLD